MSLLGKNFVLAHSEWQVCGKVPFLQACHVAVCVDGIYQALVLPDATIEEMIAGSEVRKNAIRLRVDA